MGWNLREHILDHALSIIDTTGRTRPFDPKEQKNQHFTASVDISQFIVKHRCKNQECIDIIMQNFLKDLSLYTHTFIESKGRNKKGEQIKREVVFNFDDCLLAYHNSASDNINSQNYTVEPHIHILFHKNKKLGIGYFQLRKAITEMSEKHNLVFNFQEEVPKKEIQQKSLKQKATAFTWSLKRANDKQFATMIDNDTVKKQLEDFKNYYKETENLQYFIKGMVDLEKRLERQNLTLEIEGNAMLPSSNFPLYLTPEQIKTIQILYNTGSIEEIYALLSQRDNKIARAYIEHIHGFQNTVIHEIERRMQEPFPMREIDVEKINLDIQKKCKKDIKPWQPKPLTLNQCIEKDVKSAINAAKSIEEFKHQMLELGYEDFALVSKNLNNKRLIAGFSFSYKNKKKTIHFSTLKLSFNAIEKMLSENIKTQSKKLYSHLRNYTPPQARTYQEKLFQEIYDLRASIDLSGYYIKKEEHMVSVKSKNGGLEDHGNKIDVLNSANTDYSQRIKLMLDMIESKGWMKARIEGSVDFFTQLIEFAQQREGLENVEFIHAEASVSDSYEKNTKNPLTLA